MSWTKLSASENPKQGASLSIFPPIEAAQVKLLQGPTNILSSQTAVHVCWSMHLETSPASIAGRGAVWVIISTSATRAAATAMVWCSKLLFLGRNWYVPTRPQPSAPPLLPKHHGVVLLLYIILHDHTTTPLLMPWPLPRRLLPRRRSTAPPRPPRLTRLPHRRGRFDLNLILKQ